MIDWYEHRDRLGQGDVFRTIYGDIVMLDRRVPGDGTRWYVQDWYDDRWICDDSTIEPGDLNIIIENFG